MKYLFCLALLFGCSTTTEVLPPVKPEPVCICIDGHVDNCLVCNPKHDHENRHHLLYPHH